MSNKEVLIDAEKPQVVSKRVEINEQNPEALICVYGTLRRGNGNHRALLEGRSEYMGTFRSNPNFTMYGRRAGFPIVTTKGDSSIEYEVFRITNPDVLARCHGLEGCSGIPGDPSNWYDIIPMETPVGKAWMYAMHYDARSPESVIPTGNWNDRNN